MSISKSDLNKLKKSYDKKIKVFDLIRKGENEKAKKILEKDDELLSYFIKFKQNNENQTGKIIMLYIRGWQIHYNKYHESEIVEDLNNIKKELEEKENRLEQKEYLKQQKKFLEKDLEYKEELFKDNKIMKTFTFVIAFGVIVQIFVQIISYLEKMHFANAIVLTGIYIIALIILVLLLIRLLKEMGELGKVINSNHWLTKVGILFAFLFIIAGGLLQVFNPNLFDKQNNDINNVYVNLNESKIYEDLKIEQERINSLNSVIFDLNETIKNLTERINSKKLSLNNNTNESEIIISLKK
jgi:hypothetical protein